MKPFFFPRLVKGCAGTILQKLFAQIESQASESDRWRKQVKGIDAEHTEIEGSCTFL